MKKIFSIILCAFFLQGAMNLSAQSPSGGYYDLEADGGFNINAIKLSILETPFMDRCIDFKSGAVMTPVANGYQAYINAFAFSGSPNAGFFTVYRENRNDLSGNAVPYYSFSFTYQNVEYFLNVTNDSVYWTATDKATLLDYAANPDAFPNYKFCLPYQVNSLGNKSMINYGGAMFPAVYLLTLDNDPYLLAAGGASKYIAAKKLSGVMTNGNIDPLQVTSWIFGGAVAATNYEIQLYSTTRNVPVKGLAADGEAKIEIRVRKLNSNAPNASNIDFRLINTNVGELSGGQSTANYYSKIYTAPNFFDGTGINKIQQVEAKITYANGTTETLTQQITIIRPPVMLVHGLNSDAFAFEKLGQKLTNGLLYNRDQVLNVDYSATNQASFEENKNVIPRNLKNLLYKVTSSGYEVKKADVVAHSMGGILTRQYLQSDIYNYDINRIITLNTPHSGSQAANFLLLDYNPIAWTARLKTELKGPAITDLCVDSKAIAELNGISLNKNIVPSHAIVTDYSDNYDNFHPLSPMEAALVIAYISGTIGGDSEIFRNEQNDLIVAESSQKGGLGSTYTSLFFGIWHTESPENDNVLDKVIELLKTSPNDRNVFSMNGYHPPVLETIHPYEKSPIMRLSEQSEIHITNIDKPECHKNETVKIHVKGSDNVTKMSLIIDDEYNKYSMATKEGNENEFAYEVPSYAVGEKNIFAIGYANDGTLVVDSAKINILNDASLVSFETYTNYLLLPLGTEYNIRLYGLYSDDIYRNTGYVEGMTYSSINGNVTFQSPNIMVGKYVGLDTLIVSYKGMQAVLPVEIIDNKSITNIENINPEAVNKSLNISVFPNPTASIFTLSFDNPDNRQFIVSLFNITGQKMEEWVVASNIKQFNIGKYPTGVYFVRIMTESGQSVTKKIIKK